MKRLTVTLRAILLATVACDGSTAPELPGDPSIRTEGASFHLVREGEAYRSVDIPYTFTNRTGGTVYLVNCGGEFALSLDRWEDGRWTPAWVPILPACLSPPIRIEPAETFRDTVRVFAGDFGSRFHPQFDRPNISGIYRIRWIDALSSFQDRLPFGEPIPLDHRLSNALELTTD